MSRIIYAGGIFVHTVRHFIFVYVKGWNYYITYAKSLVALLARMGQKITFFVADRHIDLVCIPPDVFSEENVNSLFKELIRQCTACVDMQTVIVTTVPDVFSIPKMKGVKYVVPDICDPLNCERLHFENGLTEYISYMADHADVMFLSGTVYEMVHKQYGSKVHRAFPAWKYTKYQFLDVELDYTPNYIHSDEMLRNAAELLMV